MPSTTPAWPRTSSSTPPRSAPNVSSRRHWLTPTSWSTTSSTTARTPSTTPEHPDHADDPDPPTAPAGGATPPRERPGPSVRAHRCDVAGLDSHRHRHHHHRPVAPDQPQPEL